MDNLHMINNPAPSGLQERQKLLSLFFNLRGQERETDVIRSLNVQLWAKLGGRNTGAKPPCGGHAARLAAAAPSQKLQKRCNQAVPHYAGILTARCLLHIGTCRHALLHPQHWLWFSKLSRGKDHLERLMICKFWAAPSLGVTENWCS